MDPTLVTSTILSVCSVLLGLNLFFLKNLIVKIESSSNLTLNNSVRVELLTKQVEDIARMRSDIEVLRYAVTGYLDSTSKRSST